MFSKLKICRIPLYHCIGSFKFLKFIICSIEIETNHVINNHPFDWLPLIDQSWKKWIEISIRSTKYSNMNRIILNNRYIDIYITSLDCRQNDCQRSLSHIVIYLKILRMIE